MTLQISTGQGCFPEDGALARGLEEEHKDTHLIPEAVTEKGEAAVLEQVPVDRVELESMESFPCSDPPGH